MIAKLSKVFLAISWNNLSLTVTKSCSVSLILIQRWMMLNLKKMKYMQLTLWLALGKERWEYLLLAYDASLFSAYLHFFFEYSWQPKLLDEKQTTIYKRAVDKNYHLKMKASRFIFSEISQKFPIMPFTARLVPAHRLFWCDLLWLCLLKHEFMYLSQGIGREACTLRLGGMHEPWAIAAIPSTPWEAR